MFHGTVPDLELILLIHDKINTEIKNKHWQSSTIVWQRIFYFKNSELVFCLFYFTLPVMQFYYILQKHLSTTYWNQKTNTGSWEALPSDIRILYKNVLYSNLFSENWRKKKKKNPNAQQVKNWILNNKKKQSNLHDSTLVNLKNHWHTIPHKSDTI